MKLTGHYWAYPRWDRWLQAKQATLQEWLCKRSPAAKCPNQVNVLSKRAKKILSLLCLIHIYQILWILYFQGLCIMFGSLMLHIPLILINSMCNFYFLLFIFSFHVLFFFQFSALWPVDKDSDTVWSFALTTGGCIQEAVVLKQNHT